MQTIQVKPDVKLSCAQQKKLKWQVGNLKGLARMLRVEPIQWTDDGRVERSLLREIQRCLTYARVTRWAARRGCEVEGMIARLDFRYEAAVRCVFGHVEPAAWIGERDFDGWDEG